MFAALAIPLWRLALTVTIITFFFLATGPGIFVFEKIKFRNTLAKFWKRAGQPVQKSGQRQGEQRLLHRPTPRSPHEPGQTGGPGRRHGCPHSCAGSLRSEDSQEPVLPRWSRSAGSGPPRAWRQQLPPGAASDTGVYVTWTVPVRRHQNGHALQTSETVRGPVAHNGRERRWHTCSDEGHSEPLVLEGHSGPRCRRQEGQQRPVGIKKETDVLSEDPRSQHPLWDPESQNYL